MTYTFNELPEAVARIEEAQKQMAATMAQLQRQLVLMQDALTNRTADQVQDRWLDVAALQDYLPDHPKTATIYQWVHARSVPFTKTGNRLRFRKSAIDEWLESNRHKTTAEMRKAAEELASKHRVQL